MANWQVHFIRLYYNIYIRTIIITLDYLKYINNIVVSRITNSIYNKYFPVWFQTCTHIIIFVIKWCVFFIWVYNILNHELWNEFLSFLPHCKKNVRRALNPLPTTHHQLVLKMCITACVEETFWLNFNIRANLLE